MKLKLPSNPLALVGLAVVAFALWTWWSKRKTNAASDELEQQDGGVGRALTEPPQGDGSAESLIQQ